MYENMHHSEAHQEMTICHCKMKDGEKECTCKHMKMSESNDGYAIVHCITDLELNPPLDKEILISWDTRNYILDNSTSYTLLRNIELEWLLGSESFADEYVTKLLRPPTLV